MRHSSRTARLLATTLALATALAACSGDGGDENGAPADPAAALSGDPIRLMVQVPLTGPSTRNPEPPVGAKAAAWAVNAAGGIKGRPLDIQVCDDQFDPGKSAGCARLAVSGGVVAYVGAYTGQGDRYMPILEKAGIPSVGNVAVSASENTSPLSYPVGSGAAVALAGVGAMMGKLGCQKIAVAYANTAGPKYVVTRTSSAGWTCSACRSPSGCPSPSLPATSRPTPARSSAATQIAPRWSPGLEHARR
jgi:ABC-type branched-subunit amino acid transport system substrate-binding protein